MSASQDPTQETPGQWLSIKEASTHFGRSPRCIRMWLDSGKLHAYQEAMKGRVEWRIWSVLGETPPPVVGRQSLVVSPEPTTNDQAPMTAEGVVIAREQFQTLLSRHEEACRRIGWLEEQLRDRLPALEGKLPALEDGQRLERESSAALAKSLATLETASDQRQRGIRRWQRGVAVALAVLAVMMAVVGGMALSRTPAERVERTQAPTPRPLQRTDPPARSPGVKASPPVSARRP